jgi:glucose-1-phosphate adenylyltransferase
MKMAGIIFSNIYDTMMGELTRHRTVASLPFGGRYRQIDFVLSNMVNSNISTVGIITKYNYQSLMDHLGSCAEWDLNRKNGGVYILPPYGTGITDVYNGKLEALYNATSFLNNANADYVVLADSTVICNIDYEEVLESHIRSGADITVVANKDTDHYAKMDHDLVLTLDGEKVVDVAINCPAGENMLAGMGMYIMERGQLLEMIQYSASHGLCHFEREFVQRNYMNGTLTINVFQFNRTVLRNHDICSYFHNNFRLMEEEVRADIFSKDAPIYTKVRDEVPTFYSSDCLVNDCLIADGCTFWGTVENSVLFRDVTIEQGAVVKNSVIMQGTHIGENSYIEYAIIDKDVIITPKTTLIGALGTPFIVAKGERV